MSTGPDMSILTSTVLNAHSSPSTKTRLLQREAFIAAAMAHAHCCGLPLAIDILGSQGKQEEAVYLEGAP